jgi:uncharacterized protein YggE
MKFRYLSLTILFLVFFSSILTAQKISEMPTISVSGVAEIFVVPDEAVFSLEVEKINMDVQIAKEENDQSVAQILALAKKFDIKSKDIKTDFISVTKKYEFVGRGDARKREFTGFAVSKTVIVKLRDLKKFEEFFSEVLKTGLSEIRRISLDNSESQKYKEEAREKAMIAAKKKAEAMARALGQTIGKAVEIQETNSSIINRYANITANTTSSFGNTGDGSGTFSAGTISIKIQVGVKFQLN